MSLVPPNFEDGPPAYACTRAVRAAYADAVLTGPELALVLKAGPPCDRAFRCDGMNCVEALEIGTCCSKDRDCAPSAYCGKRGDSIVCLAGLDPGSACTANNQCASGLCHGLTDGDGVCADQLDLSPSEPTCSNLR